MAEDRHGPKKKPILVLVGRFRGVDESILEAWIPCRSETT